MVLGTIDSDFLVKNLFHNLKIVLSTGITIGTDNFEINSC
jgi:hypothetical protein